MKPKKKLTKKRLIVLIISSILTLIATIACISIGIIFDPNGKKPYIILPSVAGVIGSMFLQVVLLIKIDPYVKEHDRKKVKNKTYNSIKLTTDIENIKQKLKNNFQIVNSQYVKKEKIAFSTTYYNLFFCLQNEADIIIEALKENNEKKFDISTKLSNERIIEIYFLEVEHLSDETKTIESLLDEQYLNIAKDPLKFIVPLIFESSSQTIYYYQKWSKLNILILATSTKKIIKWIMQ